jgi:prepilin-type N-terminal cleavage/methylation domain-containing protein
MNRPYHRCSAFTLIELIAVIVVLSIISAVLSGVIYQSSKGYAVSEQTLNGTDQAGFVLEKVGGYLKGLGESSPGVPDLASITATGFTQGDGRVVDYDGQTLGVTRTEVPRRILAQGVESFSLEYFDSAGDPITPTDPGAAEQVVVTQISVTIGGATLRTRVFLRANLGRAG